MHPEFTPRDIERFWSKVDRSGGPEACHPWMAGRTSDGYGVFRLADSRPQYTHRIAWKIIHGAIPEGVKVRHLVCDNPPCCNPAHLALGTTADNNADMVAKQRNRGGIMQGRRNGQARLTDEAVREIRRRYTGGNETKTALARNYGVSRSCIKFVIDGTTWRHVHE